MSNEVEYRLRQIQDCKKLEPLGLMSIKHLTKIELLTLMLGREQRLFEIQELHNDVMIDKSKQEFINQRERITFLESILKDNKTFKIHDKLVKEKEKIDKRTISAKESIKYANSKYYKIRKMMRKMIDAMENGESIKDFKSQNSKVINWIFYDEDCS